MRECKNKKINNNLEQPTQEITTCNNDLQVTNNLNENVLEFNNTPLEDISEELKEGLEEKSSLLEDLRNWALSNRIKQCALTALLKILKCHEINNLPSDSRTLLNTPLSINIIPMGDGFYWYNGISSNLQQNLCSIKNQTSIKLLVNIDGISPYNSSTLEFWPILFLLENMPEIKPMAAAIYYGRGKPPLDPFLTPFVDELNTLIENGIIINNVYVDVKIKCFICDSPARSFIKGKVLIQF